MLVLVLINIDGEEKIEMIPSLPGNLKNRTLTRGEGGAAYLVVLHNVWQVTQQLQNISGLGQPVVVTREEGFVAIKNNTDFNRQQTSDNRQGLYNTGLVCVFTRSAQYCDLIIVCKNKYIKYSM